MTDKKKETGTVGHLDNGRMALSLAVMALIKSGLLVPVEEEKPDADQKPSRICKEKP